MAVKKLAIKLVWFALLWSAGLVVMGALAVLIKAVIL